MRVSRSLMSPSYWRRSFSSEPSGGHGEPFVALDHRQSHEVSTVRAVEFAGADHQRRTLGDLTGQGPTVEPLFRTPKVERTFGQRRVHAEFAQGLGHQRQPRPVALALARDVFVIVVRDGDGRLHRRGHHESGVLAYRLEEVDQLLVAGVKAGAYAGQVRSLGAGVQREHAVAAVLKDRPRRAGPGELRV